MDLGEPSSVGLPSRTAAVLRALGGVRGSLSIREIARLAGVSSTRTAEVIGRLVEHGVVERQESGGAHLCQLNRDHLAAAALLDLARLRGRLLDALRNEFENWEFAPLHASLFGSTARGDGDLHSDIDILLIEPDGVDHDTWDAQLLAAGERIERRTGNHVAWVSLPHTQLHVAADAEEPIFAAWQTDGIHLTGTRLTALLSTAA